MGCRLPAAGLPLPVAPRLFRPRGDLVRRVVSCIGGGSSSGQGALCSGTGRSFGWDDVFRISSEDRKGPSGLNAYFERVRSCNRGSEFHSEFVAFVIEGQIVGYIHHSFVNHLKGFSNVFMLMSGDNKGYTSACVTFHPSLRSSEDRTIAVGDVIKSLGSLIPGIRNELYPVSASYGLPVFFSLERAAAPYFGIKAYGVHMNGYIEKDEKKYLWIGKRSESKPTYPGMLDHLVAGGLPHGITCKANIIKECHEEAGIPESISCRAIPVGAVSYVDIDGPRYKRDVLFCYDLRLPDGFVPKNEDGEVDSFNLIPVDQVANIILRTEFFKPNCALVIIDFLFRHGFIAPDDAGYLQLLQLLRGRDCS
ncbi:unnamed protein product [Spirodela intermedia]|uniref:Nudix hydrolase domain-containing protein n=1 Tax=Spirodela intermedia TaxID=51605 RepID=A0A7I8L182_SPIIN|nr:unnamed protein product [Spirodela intermedia]